MGDWRVCLFSRRINLRTTGYSRDLNTAGTYQGRQPGSVNLPALLILKGDPKGRLFRLLT